MPLFFLISGFCFSYNGQYKNFLLKKVNRLVIPYVAFNIIDMIPRHFLSQFVNRPQNVGKSIVDILLNGGEYWFLYVLFIIFTIYPIIYKWQIKSNVRKVIVTLVLFVLSTIGIRIQMFLISSIIYYLFYFNIGMLIRSGVIKIFNFKKSVIYSLIPLPLLVLWISLMFLPSNKLLSIIIALIGIATCYFFTGFEIFNRIFKRFGEFSLQLYLFNGFLLVISREIICRFTDIPAVIITFNMIVDFMLSYLVIKYICKRFKILRKLMGMTNN